MNENDAILICGLNWIGDSIMAMPALQAFRRAHPSVHVGLLIKPALTPLWTLHGVPDEMISLHSGWRGGRASARTIASGRFRRVYVLPHSFRSAFVPWLARVPERIGRPGHFRDWMLTEVVPFVEAPGRVHQVYEYIDLLLPKGQVAQWERPELQVPPVLKERIEALLASHPGPYVTLIPGAARGPAKQWPEAHFVEVGRMLRREMGGAILVAGSTRETDLCRRVARNIGAGAVSLAGHLSLIEWIALLAHSDLVVANDSGGMHVAAAVGTPVVALYGVTDPEKTGPLTERARLLQHSTLRSRDVARHSEAATKALASITPDEAFVAALELLKENEEGQP